MSTNYDFIKVGAAVCLKYGSLTSGEENEEKIIAYITEILGDTIITTAGSYKKEDLESVIETANRMINTKSWAEDVVKSLKKKRKGKE